MTYELHPACAMWPQPSDDEVEAIAADIKANGQKLPITLYNDQLLDGRTRQRACEIAGVTPLTQIYTGSDPIGFTVSMNLKRRHLTISQRSMMAARIANMVVGGKESNRLKLVDCLPVSLDKAAEIVDVSRASAEHGRTVLASGTPELIEATDKGEISVSAAAKIAKKQQQTAPRRENGGNKTAAPRANNTELVAKTLKAKTGQWPTTSKLAREAGVSPRAADNALRTVKAVEQAQTQAFDGEIMVSIHVLIEKLVPLFERVREQSKRHVGLISTGELLLIASEGQRLLDSWASGDEAVRRVRGHVVPPTRPTSVRKGAP